MYEVLTLSRIWVGLTYDNEEITSLVFSSIKLCMVFLLITCRICLHMFVMSICIILDLYQITLSAYLRSTGISFRSLFKCVVLEYGTVFHQKSVTWTHCQPSNCHLKTVSYKGRSWWVPQHWATGVASVCGASATSADIQRLLTIEKLTRLLLSQLLIKVKCHCSLGVYSYLIFFFRKGIYRW